MVGDEDVDDVVRRAGDHVDHVTAADEPVGCVGARVDSVPQLEAPRAQRCSCGVGDAGGCLDVQHDVYVVGGSHGIETGVDGVELGHQSADERPAVGG